MSVTLTNPVSRPMRLPATPAAPVQHVLAVAFLAPDGRTSSAIGGGPTITGAIADAREGCPYDATWDAVGWNDLYGD